MHLKRHHSLFLALLLVAGAGAPGNARPCRTRDAAAPRSAVLEGLPMAFEPNIGQFDERVSFVARGRGSTVVVSDSFATLSLGREAVSLKVEGSNAGARAVAERELPGKVNDLTGSDPSKWRNNVPTYAAVRLAGVYDGIDAVFYGNQQWLEYYFVVAPGANPSQIRVRFEGQQSLDVTEEGDLVLRMRDGDLHHARAVVFQEADDGRRHVAAKFALGPGGEIGFDVGAYDTSRPLVIDPVIDFAVYLDGGDVGVGTKAIAVAPNGSVYMTGFAVTNGFPTTPFAYDATFNGNRDVVVAQLDSDPEIIESSTFLGGFGDDEPTGIAYDATSGAVYVVGKTTSVNFPTTPGALSTTFGGDPANGAEDGFVAKFTSGVNRLEYSTFLGGSGSERAVDVAVDELGFAHVIGSTQSTDFPTTPGAYDRAIMPFTTAGFVMKVPPDGGSLAYSTFLEGGPLNAIALDAAGAALIVGDVFPNGVPVTPGAFDTTYNGGFRDAFASKLSADGGTLVYATYLGGGGRDVAVDVAAGPGGAAFVTGLTDSADYPSLGALDASLGGQSDAFVTKVSADGSSLGYSTLLGGSSVDSGDAIAVDTLGTAFVTGFTFSSDFPTTPGAFDAEYAGENTRDVFVTKLAPDGSAPVFSTYLGGSSEDEVVDIGLDPNGDVCVGGLTQSLNFPTTPGVVNRALSGAFVTKFAGDGTSLLASTFVGNLSSESATGIAVDTAGSAYVLAVTGSPRYPNTFGNAFDADFSGLSDVAITKLSPDGHTIVFSTFLGGTGYDGSDAIALGSGRDIYVAGSTTSTDFPVTPGAIDSTYNGGNGDGFVARIAADGTRLVYSTFLGGTSSDDAFAIAVRPNGVAFVAGRTQSLDFPTTAGAFDTTPGADTTPGFQDAFVAKLNAEGTKIKRSTLLGGALGEEAFALAADRFGVTVVGTTGSVDFPVSTGAFDTTLDGLQDTFVTRFNKNLTTLVSSTYLGGEDEWDYAYAVAVDAAGATYVAGVTQSSDFPVTAGAFDTTPSAHFFIDAFVTKLAPDGRSLVYSTFLGDDGSQAFAIAVDASGAAFVTGGVVDAASQSHYDVFVRKLAPDGASLAFDQTFGGSGDDFGFGITLGPAGTVFVVGRTDSPGFPIDGFGDGAGANAFVAKLTGT